jgi:hypothetical protein
VVAFANVLASSEWKVIRDKRVMLLESERVSFCLKEDRQFVFPSYRTSYQTWYLCFLKMAWKTSLVTVCLAAAIGYTLHVNHARSGASAVGKSRMKAIYHKQFGPVDDVLEMAEFPLPSYRSWEVLVEVHAASLNPVDYKIIEGAFFIIGFLLPYRPGFDFSGKVLAVGEDCKHIKVGDIVHGMTWVHKTGSLAEYLAVDESAINVVPAGLNSEQAAAMPLVAHTSYSSLVTMGGLHKGKGQRVLVLGGSSSTGIMALQLVSTEIKVFALSCVFLVRSVNPPVPLT